MFPGVYLYFSAKVLEKVGRYGPYLSSKLVRRFRGITLMSSIWQFKITFTIFVTLYDQFQSKEISFTQTNKNLESSHTKEFVS